MNSLLHYGSSDEEDSRLPKKQKHSIEINPAPLIAPSQVNQYKFITSTSLTHNVPNATLSQPITGPINPFSKNRSSQKNNLAGYVEEHAIEKHTFETLQRTFNRDGYTLGVDGHGFVGNLEKAQAANGKLINDKNVKGKQKFKREAKGSADDVDGFLGPWAKYEAKTQALEDKRSIVLRTDLPPPVAEVDQEPVVTAETSTFHGTTKHDYLGRTFMHVPTDLDIDLRGEPGRQECFIPKKEIHTWTGHAKGVNAIEFFPRYGHLLLSCSLDNTVKIWDCFHDRSLLRTYSGHGKAVKDISFSHDGRQFVSAGFDKWLKIWDTETGKCTQTCTLEKLPQCVVFNPDPANANMFMVGSTDKNIYQFDARNGELVNEYVNHVGAVNSITFVGDNDDRSLRLWEFGITKVIKFIADPEMTSMPRVSLSPSNKWLLCQSLDNQLIVYSAEKFKRNQAKKFTGHLVAGYACQPSWSPDSRFVTCGDSQGQVWFWDWKKCGVLKKLQHGKSVISGTAWNPQEQSKVASCSWDGTIKYWD